MSEEAEKVFYRFRSLTDTEQPADDGSVDLLASTDDPVDFGAYREVLQHGPGCIDMEAARALLVNHDPNQIAGPLTNKSSNGKTLSVRATINPNAKLQSNVGVLEAVRTGALRGVSIGYKYSNADCHYDEGTRILTVRKWRLLETTLTPIPADERAMVRSLPDIFRPLIPGSASPAGPIKKEARMSDADNKPNPQGQEPAAIINSAGEAAITAASEKSRADTLKETREVAEIARSVNLDVTKYIGMRKADAQDQMMKDLAEKNRSVEPKGHAVSNHIDQVDKARDAFTGALAHQVGMRSGDFAEMQKKNPLVGQGIQHSIRRYARLIGINTEDWSKQDVAYFALGKREMMTVEAQRAANISTASFPNFVMLNAITKIVAAGYEMGSATARYRDLVSTQRVPDFKQFSIGALGTGNLQQTAENVAFPELAKSEGVYNSTVKMWGGTLSLTLQAMINDDTSSFDRSLRQAGAIADKTIDRRVFQKLLMGTSSSEGSSTWTSNTTSGGSLVYTTADLAVAARGKLGLVRAALANKVGLDGNPLGTMPRFLIVPVTREVEAQGIVGPISPGQIGQNTSQPSITSLQVVATPWLEASALTGYSTTSYYLLADPTEVTGLVLSEINGFEGIQVMPYDAGAVAAMNWKIWKPFEVDMHYLTVGTTATIAAAQQGTT